MTREDLEQLYDYASWANRRLLGVLEQLSPEEFTREVAGGFGSIRNTLVHVMSAEAGWLERCGGPVRGPRLNPADFPTLDAVFERWHAIAAAMRTYLASMSSEDVQRFADYSNDRGEGRRMPVGELLQHAAVHAVHHRGQVAMMVRMLGHAPAPMDIVLYHAERRGVQAF